MLVSPTTFIILKGLAGILLFALSFYFIKQRLDSNKKVVISILAGVIGFSAMQFAFAKVYTIDYDLVYKEFYLLGNTKQDLGNGKIAKISPSNFQKVTLINKSRFNLVLEEIIYTDNANSVSSNGDYEIPPHAAIEVFLPQNEITYFFNQNIPDAVKVRGSSSKTNYWLRLESQADNDDSADEYE